MPSYYLALVFLLLPVVGFFPGFFFVRHLRLSPPEKMCVSVAVSLIILYLMGIIGLPMAGTRQWLRLYPVVALFLAVVCREDFRQLLGHLIVRRTAKAFAACVLLGLVALACVDVNSGGNIWTVDFVEHFERTKAIMGDMPFTATFGLHYSLPARPALMHSITACVMGALGEPNWTAYQLVYAMLNLTVFLSVALIAPLLVRRGRPDPWALAAILFCSPIFFQNTTYAWPKLFDAFFVILALALYLRAMAKDCRTRFILAFLFLAAGFLVHYCAGPFIVVLASHYLITHAKRWRTYWRNTLAIALTSALFLATWFGFCIHRVGLDATIAGPKSVTGFSEKMPSDKVKIILVNLYETLVPYFLRGVEANEPWQTNVYARVRDQFFCYYQTNLFGLMGSAGALLVAVILLRDRKPDPNTLSPLERERLRRNWIFWACCVPGVTLLGIAVVQPIVDQFGVALTCLIPMGLIGMALVSHGIHRAGVFAKVLFAGLILDFLGGVLLHYYVQSLDIQYVRISATEFVFDPPKAFGHLFTHHHAYKRENGLVFFHDLFTPLVPAFLLLMTISAAGGIAYLAYRAASGPPHGAIRRGVQRKPDVRAGA